MGFKISSPVATSVSSLLPRHKGAELLALPKRPIAGMHPKAGTFDHPEVRPGVRPELLAETQAIVFPAGITLSALAAEIFYFDVILHSSAPGTFYLGAGALAAIVMFLIAGLSDLNSTASIVAGEAKARIILPSASTKLLAAPLPLLSAEYFWISFSRAWFALWYAFSVVFLLAARFGILLWARLLKAETPASAAGCDLREHGSCRPRERPAFHQGSAILS